MFGVGITLIIIGILSFILPLFGGQFKLVSAVASESGGSGSAGLIFIAIGFVICYLASIFGNSKSR